MGWIISDDFLEKITSKFRSEGLLKVTQVKGIGIGSGGRGAFQAGQYFLRSGGEKQHGRVKCIRGKTL